MTSGRSDAQDIPDPSRPGQSSGPGGHSTADPRAKRRGAKILVTAALAVLVVVFVIRNSGPVRVDFVVSSGHPRLIWLIVGCIVTGVAVGYFLGRPGGNRHHRG